MVVSFYWQDLLTGPRHERDNQTAMRIGGATCLPMRLFVTCLIWNCRDLPVSSFNGSSVVSLLVDVMATVGLESALC